MCHSRCKCMKTVTHVSQVLATGALVVLRMRGEVGVDGLAEPGSLLQGGRR